MGLDELREMLYCELEELTASGEISLGSLEAIGELLDAIKDIESIEMYSNDGYSRDYARDGSSYRYARDGYAMDSRRYSNARRRNRMGQFSRNGSYSRSGEEEKILGKLEELMGNLTDEGDRETIRKTIEMMGK